MSTSRVLLGTSTSTFICTITASATALALAATVAATSWFAGRTTTRTGATQHVSHLHMAGGSGPSGSGASSGGTVPPQASTAVPDPPAGGPFAQTLSLTLAKASRASESRELAAREIAWGMMRRFCWRPRFQFRYLRWLWDRESSWNVYASNPYTGAYGIPQAVPGYKMSSAGRDWQTSPRVQIRWGLRYIRARYRSPRAAWHHEVAYGWY